MEASLPKTVYKVVRNVGGFLYSASIESPLRLCYGLHSTTRPTLKGSYIMAFTAPEYANAFRNEMDLVWRHDLCSYSVEIYRATAEIVEFPSYEVVRYLNYYQVGDHGLQLCQRFWEAWGTPNMARISGVGTAPRGTIFCKSITLEEVYKK